MRFLIFFIFILIPFSAMSGSLLWSQEFNDAKGALPDPSYWRAELGDGCEAGNCGWGNNERQNYSPSAASIDGKGHLVLTATRQSDKDCYYGKCEWTSARYDTSGRVSFRYGLMEARIQSASGQGAWPAFWLLGAEYPRVQWPNCGELDIAEWFGSPSRFVFGTAHGGSVSSPFLQGGRFANQRLLTAGFHTYGLRWLPEELTWLIDGKPYYTLKKRDLKRGDWRFDNAMFLLVNLAMGGNLGGPISPSLKTSTFTIDWIRYSRVDGYGEVVLAPAP